MSDYIYLGRGEDAGGGREKPSILSDTFEALTGAIYLDGGFDEAKHFVHSFVIDKIDEMSLLRDGKSLIQKYVQKDPDAVLSYHIDEIGEPGDVRRFAAKLYIDGRLISEGRGQSKKQAEQEAAVAACRKFNIT